MRLSVYSTFVGIFLIASVLPGKRGKEWTAPLPGEEGREKWVRRTYAISLLAQFLFGVASLAGLAYRSPKTEILWEVLLLEEISQVVEFVYYLVVTLFLRGVRVPTVSRYVDWVVTTPCMLVSLCGFCAFYGEASPSLSSLFSSYPLPLASILLSDLCMLGFGACLEVGKVGTLVGVGGGGACFCVSLLYVLFTFAWKSAEGAAVWSFVACVWAAYSVAAVLPYNSKNVAYNALDVVAKNFFGLLLSAVVISLSES